MHWSRRQGQQFRYIQTTNLWSHCGRRTCLPQAANGSRATHKVLMAQFHHQLNSSNSPFNRLSRLLPQFGLRRRWDELPLKWSGRSSQDAAHETVRPSNLAENTIILKVIYPIANGEENWKIYDSPWYYLPVENTRLDLAKYYHVTFWHDEFETIYMLRMQR